MWLLSHIKFYQTKKKRAFFKIFFNFIQKFKREKANYYFDQNDYPWLNNLFEDGFMLKQFKPKNKFGIIDAEGNPLKKIKDLKTSEEKDAYDMLDRLVFSLKRLLAKIPGGSSKIASLAAAYWLVKESYETQEVVTQEQLNSLVHLIESNQIVLKEQSHIQGYLSLTEDGAIANATGAATATNEPVVKLNKKNKTVSGIISTPNYVVRRNKKITPMG